MQVKGLLGLVSGRGNLNKRNHSNCFHLWSLGKKSLSQLFGQIKSEVHLDIHSVFLVVTGCLAGKDQHLLEVNPQSKALLNTGVSGEAGQGGGGR